MFPKNVGGKRLDSDRDLEQYGIYRLTGEACGIGLRMLCDLSPKGVALMEEMLSIKFTDENNSWNHQGKDGWKSIMIPWSLMTDIMVYALSKEYQYVARVEWRVPWANAYYVEGFQDKESYLQFKESANKVYVTDDRTAKEVLDDVEPRTKTHWKVYITSGTASGGTRNQHYFSGRTE